MTFEPIDNGNGVWMIIGIVLFLLGVLGFFKFDDRKFRILQMLSGFLACIALGVALFSGWANSRIEPLTIKENHFMIGEEQYNYKHIRSLEIMDSPKSVNGKILGARLLVLDMKTQEAALIFSEDNFEITTIFGIFKEKIQALKPKKSDKK